ncbi:MAG: metalloprotease TldD [Candidatus Eutrophobiaceae bacterium]
MTNTTQTALEVASHTLLDARGLEMRHLDDAFASLMAHSLDYADIYLESTHSESWSFEDGLVRQGSFNIDQGAGVRAVSGDKTGFAYADEIVLPALREAAIAARAISRQGGSSGRQLAWRRQATPTLYAKDDPLCSIPDEDKVALLHEIDRIARARDPRVKEVMASLNGQMRIMLVADSSGQLTADLRPLVRIGVSVFVEENGRRERGSAGGGGRSGYEYFLENKRYVSYIDQALEEALINLRAVNAPAGTMPVVLGPGWPGILLHEAIGHGLEGDFNRKRTSVYSGRIGERIASPGVTVVDDGSIANRRGSLNVDDEGTPTQRTTLIEDGILKGYMQDNTNARLMKTRSTGNGRRESYAHATMPRMTNTFMLAGKLDPQEIISSVSKGIYASSFSGGQVDITSGKFVFSASQAWLIENGQLTQPVRGATLIGDGAEVLRSISMIGNDMQLDEGIGVCGKDGQQVPVGVGQPTLLIDELTVGGTQV